MYNWILGLLLTILSALGGETAHPNEEYSLVYMSDITSQSIFKLSEGNVQDFPSFELKPTPTPIPSPPVAVVAAAAPPPPPPPVSVGGSLTQDQVRAILAQAGFSGQLLEEALVISYCESTWNAGIANTANTEGPYGSHGLFQIWYGNFAGYGYDPSLRYDPLVNSIVAYNIRQQEGRWGTTHGWFNCAAKNGIW